MFKGAQLQHALYPEPHLRPCTDVDVLVSPQAFRQAMDTLQRQGFVLLKPRPRAFEVTLTRHRLHLDLHACPIRPCRLRRDITDELLARRIRCGDLWAPSDLDNTFIALVHPAITDYVTGKVVRAVDLDRWVRSRSIDWDAVVGLLSETGLRTAAWAMLTWTRWLFDTPVPESVVRRIAPSPWRAWYLERWLELEPPRVYRHNRWLARGGFSLALHDQVRDTARATAEYWASRRRSLALPMPGRP